MKTIDLKIFEAYHPATLSIMKLLFKLVAILALIFFGGCEEDDVPAIGADLSLFEQVGEEPFAAIAPSVEIDYWELLSYSPDVSQSPMPLHRHGTKCARATNQQTCEQSFDSLISEEGGFREVCNWVCFYYYIKYQQGNEAFLITRLQDLKEFLGDIDAESDALLWAYGNGYYTNSDKKETAAIRKLVDGYELLALKNVSMCTPYQNNRFYLHINAQGAIKILGEEVYHKDANDCYD